MGPESSLGPLLVVSGLAVEAQVAAGLRTVCVAAPPAALAGKLAELKFVPSAVISFGLCGGLAPQLRAGMLAVGTQVLFHGETWSCDPDLTSGLMAAPSIGADVTSGPFACVDAPVLTVGEKTALERATGAVAVDTESHVAAAYARERGLPFAVLRAVSDPADKDLPPLAVRAIGADGRLDWRAIGGELAGRPGQLLKLPDTALSTWRALRTLRRVRRRLGPRFGL